jgi:hypothetical protein
MSYIIFSNAKIIQLREKRILANYSTSQNVMKFSELMSISNYLFICSSVHIYNKPIIHDVSFDSLLPYVNTP